MSGDAALVVVEGLGRRHAGRAAAALDDVSLAIGRDEVFGVVGPSGSGKSTLARLLVALDRPTAGTVRFDGIDLFALPARRLRALRTRFQLVFQDPLAAVDPRFTARQTLDEAIAAGRGGGGGALKLAEITGIAQIDPATLARRPHALSGGERQRIALARALAVDPELVIIDEATASLDVVTRRALLERLLAWRRARGASVVVISHDVRLVAAIADRAVVLEGGRVAAAGAARDVITAPGAR